jgi:hypothetical protein
MMVLLTGLALVFGTALLVYRKRRSAEFFDPHHQQAFELLAQSFPETVTGGQREEKANA